MKLRLHQKQELEETEIDIVYSRMTKRLSKMVSYIRQYAYMVEAFCDGKSFLIPLDEILYFDTTDRKTFLYYCSFSGGINPKKSIYIECSDN